VADNNQSKLFFGGKAVDDFVENHEHVSPVSMYLKVLFGLFILTGLTYAVSYADLGPASLPVAMIVAAMKATLVCAFFMHLLHDDKFHVFIFVASLGFVAIFFAFTIFDLEARDRLHEVQGTDFRRAEGGWDDMGRMAAANKTDVNKPACSDGTIPMCEEAFPACNPEGTHAGEEFLVRRIENGCFVSQMVPAVGADGKPQVQDGVPVMVDAGCVKPALGCLNPHTAEGVAAAKPKPAAPAEGKAEGKAPAKADAKAAPAH
jgi:cytochrome c oxidase subunit 4